jgi:Coenzyme PQQ synthesis protein D (PqqD)
MVGDRAKRRSDVSIREVEGDTVVLDRGAEQIHRLNSTASFIWHRCDGRRTVRDIADDLADSFDVDPAAANEVVVTALRQLDQLGLLDHTLG